MKGKERKEIGFRIDGAVLGRQIPDYGPKEASTS